MALATDTRTIRRRGGLLSLFGLHGLAAREAALGYGIVGLVYLFLFGFVASVKNFPLPKFFPDQMKQAFTDSLKEPSQTQMPVIKGLAEVYNIIRDHHDALMNLKETPAEYTKALDEELKKAMNAAYG